MNGEHSWCCECVRGGRTLNGTRTMVKVLGHNFDGAVGSRDDGVARVAGIVDLGKEVNSGCVWVGVRTTRWGEKIGG